MVRVAHNVVDQLGLEHLAEVRILGERKKGTAAIGAHRLRFAVSRHRLPKRFDRDLGRWLVAHAVAHDVAREVVEHEHDVNHLTGNPKLQEVQLPDGIAARSLEACRLLEPFGAGTSMHQLVAVLLEYLRDGLERDAPSPQSLELGTKLRRAVGGMLLLDLEDPRDLLLTQTVGRIRWRVG
jgi:hypothetical protein